MIDHSAVGLSEPGSSKVLFRAGLVPSGERWRVQLPPALTWIWQAPPHRPAMQGALRHGEGAPVGALHAAAPAAGAGEASAPAALRAQLRRFGARSRRSQHRSGVP